jgi:hypothetical protein
MSSVRSVIVGRSRRDYRHHQSVGLRVGPSRGIDPEVSCRHLEDGVSTASVLVVASFIATLTSGCALLAQAQNGQPQGTTPTDAQRRECERNGGYWTTAAGFCRIGA